MKGRRLLVLVLITLLAAGVVAVLRPSSPEAPSASGDLQKEAASPTTQPVRVRKQAAPAPATVPPPPERVDLERVDRDLDLHGVVVDAAGTPVAGAALQCLTRPWTRVLSRRLDWTANETLGPATRSSTDGTFALRLSRHATTTLRVSADGFATIDAPSRRAGERVRIVLTRPVTVRVHTTDGEGGDVGEVRLRLDGSADAGLRRDAVTDDAGLATWTDLPAGCAATLIVEAPTRGGLFHQFTTPDAGETTVELPLRAGRAFAGRVTDARTGEPIAGARVGIDTFLLQSVATGADGRYSLVGWPNTYQLAAVASGYAREQASAADRRTIDFALQPGFAVTGRVVDVSGAPVGGARVTATGWAFAGGETYSAGHATSNADGRFRVDDLRQGLDHKLLVIAPGHARALVVCNSSRPDIGDVILGPPRTLPGRVVDAAGQPMADAPVALIQTSHDEERIGDPEERARTDDLGRFAFADLAPGRYLVRCQPDGGPGVRVAVEVPPDSDLPQVTVRMSEGRWIAVQVVDETGAPIAGAIVNLSGKGFQLGVRTDARGAGRLFAQIGVSRLEVQPPSVGARVYETPEPIAVPPAGAGARFVLTTAGRATGTLVNADGSAPPRAWIDALRDGRRISRTMTASDGSFDAVVPASGAASLVYGGPTDGTVENRAFWDLAARMDGVVAGATGLVLRLGRAVLDATLVVRVVSPSGDPVPGVSVSVLSMSTSSPQRSTTGSDGRAAFAGLPRREVSVSLAPARDHPDWTTLDMVRAVPNGQEVEAAYVEGVRIQGVVTSAEPLDGMTMVNVHAFVGERQVASGGSLSSSTTGEWSFTLRIPATEPGPFRLVATGAMKAHGLKGSIDGVAVGTTDVRIVAERK